MSKVKKLVLSKRGKLVKKKGVDKLVITLVLIAVGIGLCIIFRNNINSTMTTALTTLSSQINKLMAGTVN